MSDMISRSALKKDLLDRSFFPVIVKNALENAPTVDAVEVVRCKDCKWCVNKDELVGCGHCNCVNRDVFVNDPEGFEAVSLDDFCSYGERRGDE